MSVPIRRLGRMLRRWRAALRDAVKQQITLAGVLFTALVTLVGLAAFASANNLLFLLFAALLSTMLVSGLVSRLGLAGLEIALDLPEHIPAKRKVVGRVVVANSKWTPSFSIHLRGGKASGIISAVYFPVIPARARLSEPVEVQFARRGLYRETDFQFSSLFPFGFTERFAGVTLEHDVVVYPSLDPRGGFEVLLERLAGELESNYRGSGYDFYRIRPYEYMESARHVDWRASAHTGELQVREFAREEQRAVTVFLDLNIPPAQRARFEDAVDCAAFLVWRLAQHGTRVRLLTWKFDRTVPDDADVYAILRYLALVEPEPGSIPPPPDAQSEIYLALTAQPVRLAEAGWLEDRVFDLARLDSGSATDARP